MATRIRTCGQILTSISFFTKIVIGDVPGQNLCNFLSAVLEKVAVVNLNNILKN